MFSIKNTNQAIDNIEKLYDVTDKATVIFKDGIKNYLYTNKAEFNNNLNAISQLETEVRIIRREVENNLYTQPALMRDRGDFMQLLALMDRLVNRLNDTMFNFEVENPYIPAELNNDFMKLAELAVQSVECTVTAIKSYFESPEIMSDRIHRIYFYERETFKQGQAIKRKVFHNMNALKLNEKLHLRDFIQYIEDISNVAESVANQLSVMSIKQSL